MSFLSFFGILSPAERVRKAEDALRSGLFDKATEQINWLVQNAHPSAAATLARLHLTKAQKALPEAALTELDLLYAVRQKHPAADMVLLAQVEKESADLLASNTEALAKPHEKLRKWTKALTHYDAALKLASGVVVLIGGPALGKLQSGAVNCHEHLLRTEIEPKLTSAATSLPLGKYEEAEQLLTEAAGVLRGPFAASPLRERAAVNLRPLVQTQLAVTQQARLIAEVTRQLVQARQTLEAVKRPTLPELTQTIAGLSEAKTALEEATKAGMPAHAHTQTLRTQMQQLSGRALRCRGEQHELAQHWFLAHNDYEAARAVFQEQNEAVVVATMQLRQSIVAMKSGEGQVVTDAQVIGRAEPKVRLDMAYRAAVSYLQAGQFETASMFVPHLTGQLPEAATLAAAVSQQRLQALRQEIEQANALAQNEDATFAGLKQLYDELPGLAQRAAVANPALGRQLTDLLPFVFGRMLTVGLAQDRLPALLDLLTAQPGFHTKPEQLKNVGIVCLRLAVNQGITAANYQRVVALWLTALHSNEVLLASLESTRWDDDYTFTLADSLGVQALTELPENVNRRLSSETNISLGEAQGELMRAFEKAIHSIDNSQLQAQVVAFYDQQRTGLRNLIELLNEGPATVERPFAATPFAGAQLSLNEPIVQYLLARYQQTPNERLLERALPFKTLRPQPLLVSYQAAIELESKAEACFASPRRTSLLNLPALLKTGAGQLKSYPQLQQRVLARLTDEVKKANQQEADGQLVGTFEALVAAFPAHEPFKVLGAHHLCDWCISSLEDEKMTYTKALERLSQGWGWVPDDQRLAANLCIVFGLVCKEASKAGSANDSELAALEKTYSLAAATRNRTIKQEIANELLPMQQQFLSLLRGAKIDVNALIAAARLGYSTQFSADGLALGKKLLVMQKMTALAA